MFSSSSSFSPEQICQKFGKFSKKLDYDLKPKLGFSQEGLENKTSLTYEIFEPSIVSASTKSGDSSCYGGMNSTMDLDSNGYCKGSTLSDILESEELKF